MKILISGANGYIGRYLLSALGDAPDEKIILSRTAIDNLQSGTRHIRFDLRDVGDRPLWPHLGSPDTLIHLAWGALADYKSQLHFEESLPQSASFIENLVKGGLKRVVVLGTCLEYGLKEGCLREDMKTSPITPYGEAKDLLRRRLENLQKEGNFSLLWLRLFYTYGPVPKKRSIYSQLLQAIERGDEIFPMSAGEQVRDFMPTEIMTRLIAKLARSPNVNGVINCCSGSPVTLRSFIEERIAELGAKIRPEFGALPPADYEPFAFWGSTEKLTQALQSAD